LWPARLTVKAIGWSSSAVAVGALFLFVLILSLPSRKIWLAPLTLFLLPLAIACVVVGGPFWAIGAACGLWLYDKEGVHGKIEPEGIRLDSVRTSEPAYVAWQTLQEVTEILEPLILWYELRLKAGSKVRIDIVDRDPLKRALEARGIPLKRVMWHSRER
jgi:hypothetical protein